MQESERPENSEPGGKDEERSTRMRRSVSRRSLLTDELSRSAVHVARALPGFAPVLGLALRESAARRDERLVRNLWRLVLRREPKAHESEASLELVRKADTPDEKGDALADVLWALCRTQEFEDLKHPNERLLTGFYQIALNRDPTDAESEAALKILGEAEAAGDRIPALEGLFTGLIRSWESVLRKNPGQR